MKRLLVCILAALVLRVGALRWRGRNGIESLSPSLVSSGTNCE